MMLQKRIFSLLSLVLFSLHLFSSENKADSLIAAVQTVNNDTNKVKILNDICWEIMESNPDSAIYWGNKAEALAQELHWEKGLAETIRNVGTCYFLKANYPAALEHYFNSLKLEEKIGNKRGMAANMANIGLVYKNQDEPDKALEYYEKALKIDEEINSKRGMASDLGNIGNIYKMKKGYEKALEYHQKALGIYKELNNKKGLAINYGSIGNIYKIQNDFENALVNYNKSLLLYEEIDNKNGIVINLSNLGYVYIQQKLFKKAEEVLFKALKTSKDIDLKKQTMEVEGHLSDMYVAQKDFEKAFFHYKNSMELKDSIFSEEKNEELVRKEMTYDFEKKEAANKAEQEKQNLLAQEQIKQKEKERNYFIVGFILVAIMAGLSYRSFRQKQKANRLITLQKQMLEQKQKELLDSIEYAKRIQLSILPNENYISRSIKKLNKKS
ncbi:MAG: tetratricopeptide repeat protein [Bacteroidia bacterium]|nr:tetratricopeptide repeat protein [Bacteroidia bacterium]